MKKLLLIAAASMTVASSAWANQDLITRPNYQTPVIEEVRIGLENLSYHGHRYSQGTLFYDNDGIGISELQAYNAIRTVYEQLLSAEEGVVRDPLQPYIGGFDRQTFTNKFDLVNQIAQIHLPRGSTTQQRNLRILATHTYWAVQDFINVGTIAAYDRLGSLEYSLESARATIASQDDLILRQTLQITEKDVQIAERDSKLTSIADIVNAANVTVPDNITVQGQRAHNRGQRGVDLQTWTGSSNPRRPWQRNQVTVRTTINGDVNHYNVITTRNLAGQIDALARKVAKGFYDKGYDEGYEDGYESGYRDGYRDGYNQALTDVGAEL